MPFEHILDLNERRAAYANLLQALYLGTVDPGEGWEREMQMADLAAKIVTIDRLIASRDERPPRED